MSDLSRVISNLVLLILLSWMLFIPANSVHAQAPTDEELKELEQQIEQQEADQAEAKKRAQAEAQRKVGEEAQRRAEEAAARLKVEEEARRKAEAEVKRMADEAKKQAEEAARKQAESEKQRAAEEKAKLKAEQEAKQKAEVTVPATDFDPSTAAPIETAKQKAEVTVPATGKDNLIALSINSIPRELLKYPQMKDETFHASIEKGLQQNGFELVTYEQGLAATRVALLRVAVRAEPAIGGQSYPIISLQILRKSGDGTGGDPFQTLIWSETVSGSINSLAPADIENKIAEALKRFVASKL